jgi:succinate dehydrogenase/fumarate reductase flavoprotein subunit
MLEKFGSVIDTDVLVIGGGAGGLWAGLSAKRHNPSMRVTVLDARMVGRSGHAAFSNAWMAVVTPDDDLAACAREIVEGNEWIADQLLIHNILALSYDQLLELEKMGLGYPKKNGKFIRRPTRGLDRIRVLKPNGGGLEFCWTLRKALEQEAVSIVEQIFITDLLPDESGGIAGAVGIHGRTGEFCIVRAKATVVATNSVTFRSGFVRDLTGTGPILAYRAGATLTNAEFGYLRPGTPRFYFEGITYAIQDGAKFRNAKDEAFMERYDTKWADKADVHSITKAMIMEKQAGNVPLYLDMSLIPEEKRDEYLTSTVAWMDSFYKKLGARARIDMFGKTEYFPIYQITKMGIKTDSECCSEIQGLFAAGLAQVACATHFAELHIAACNGTGWISGKSAVRHAQCVNNPGISAAYVSELKDAIVSKYDPKASAHSDPLLVALQRIMFRYDVSMLKTEERLTRALEEVTSLKNKLRNAKVPHPHEFVRLSETDCMIETAEMILRASLARKESRLSHIREDFPERDDETWLKWVLIKRGHAGPEVSTAPIVRPLFT